MLCHLPRDVAHGAGVECVGLIRVRWRDARQSRGDWEDRAPKQQIATMHCGVTHRDWGEIMQFNEC